MEERRAAIAEAIDRSREVILDNGAFLSGEERRLIALNASLCWREGCGECAHHLWSKGGEGPHGGDVFLCIAHAAAVGQRTVTKEFYDWGVTKFGEEGCMAEALVVASWACGLEAIIRGVGNDCFGRTSMQWDDAEVAGKKTQATQNTDFIGKLEKASAGWSSHVVTESSKADFSRCLNLRAPWSGVHLAGNTLSSFVRFMDVVYCISENVVQFGERQGHPGPGRFLSRPQVESVAAATTSTLECPF